MSIKRKKKQSSFQKLSFKNKGFSGFFLLVVIAMSVFLAGAFEAVQTSNPTQAIPDPNQKFLDPTGKESLQLKTIGFISISPTPVASISGAKVNCEDTNATENYILVGSDPPSGGTVTNGSFKIWVNDEGAPFIAPGEQVDPTTGLITKIGDRTALDTDTDGKGKYLWEPAIYLTTIQTPNQVGPFTGDAESGGKPYFPSIIKGDYNNGTPRGRSVKDKGKSAGQKGPAMDTPPSTNLKEKYTAEYIWNVDDLKKQGVIPGLYHVEEVIHDGDVNIAINCIALQMQ